MPNELDAPDDMSAAQWQRTTGYGTASAAPGLAGPEAATANQGMRGPGANDVDQFDEMGQPLHGRSNYHRSLDQLSSIWNSDRSPSDKLLQTWKWGNYTVPDAEKRRQEAMVQWGLAPPTEEARRLEQVESSPLGAIAYGATALLGGNERVQGLALDAGGAMDGLLMSGSALKLRVPLYTGALRPPEVLEAARTTANAEVPYGGRPATSPAAQVGIKTKGAALEAAATVSALRRGAIKLFNAKHGNDNGLDRPYLMRDETGYPQLHNDVVKAYSGDVPLTGKGSPTEIGTNKAGTRIKNEGVLADRIANTPTDDNFTDSDKKIALEQLEKGNVVINLVGKTGTRFRQGHIDFINNKTPYKMGEIRTLDPIVPIFDGDAYGTSSIYVSHPPWEKN